MSLDTVSPWGFPIWYLSALFPYFLNTYAHSFSRTPAIYSLSLFRSFNHSAFLLCSFLTPQILPQNFVHSSAFSTSFDLIPLPFNSASIFFCSRSKIPFCLNCSILCSYLFTFALFASILCFSSSVTVFNPFLLTLYISYSYFIFCFPFKVSCQQVYVLSQFLYISFNSASRILHLGSYFSLFSPILSVLLRTHLQL